MKKLMILIKNNFLQISKINQLRYGNIKIRKNTLLIYLVAVAIIIGLSVYWIYGLNKVFSLRWTADEICDYLAVPMVLICFILNIFMGAFRGSGLLFSDSNFEFRFSMPITSIVLMLSKLSILYLFQLIIDMLLIFPMLVMYGIITNASVLFYILMSSFVLSFPVVPGFVGTIIGAGFFCFFRNSSAIIVKIKSILIVLTLFVFILFMFFQFPSIMNGNISLGATVLMFHELICKKMQQLLQLNFINVCFYFTKTLIVGAVLGYILSNIHYNWYCGAHSKGVFIKKNRTELLQSTVHSALLLRERRRYFSIPVYITNTSCGYMLAAVFVLIVVSMNKTVVPYIDYLEYFYKIDHGMNALIYIYLFTILTTLSSTTYASWSIEGRQMEMMKLLPISMTDMLKAKIQLHMSLAVPVIIVLNTIMACYLQFSLPVAVISYVLPLLYSVFIGVLGCIVNLVFPNFEWDNATYVIKQSLPAILSSLIGAVTSCGSMVLVFKYFRASLLFGSCVVCMIIFLIICCMALWLKNYHY